MTTQWDPRSTDLSDWEQGIINGETKGMKFVYVFHHGISATIRNINGLNTGQTVKMLIRGRGVIDSMSTMSSQHDVEQVFVIPKEPSLLDVYPGKKGLFLKVLMGTSIDGQGRSRFYDSFIGEAFDPDNIIPDNLYRQGKNIVVDVLARKCERDNTKCYWKIVHYYGQSDATEVSIEARIDESGEALIRRVNEGYYYAWCKGKSQELKIRKELLVTHDNWLGKWVSFKELHRMPDGSISILKSPQLVARQCNNIVVNGDSITISIECKPLRVENGVQIYETNGAGNMIDTLHILDNNRREFPRFLQLEPELNHPTCLWRVSREKEAKDANKKYEGCIITVNTEMCWIWCRDFLTDVTAGIDKIKEINDPIGKWVSFPEPIKTGMKIRVTGPITLLEKNLLPTRVCNKVPELEVTCTNDVQTENDGSRVLGSEEVGDVLVTSYIVGKIRQLELPCKLWVVKYNEKNGQYRSRWKVSYENDFRSSKPPIITSTENVGCITAIRDNFFFIWSRDYESVVFGGLELLKNVRDPLGQWISFPPPGAHSQALRTRGPVELLRKPSIDTRVVTNIVEFGVKLVSEEGKESDGKCVFWTEEVGEVVDCADILKNQRVSFPIYAWVISLNNQQHRTRFMIRSITSTVQLLEQNEQSRYKGIIVNEKEDLCWALSTQLTRNTAIKKQFLGTHQNYLGKWVAFSTDSYHRNEIRAVDPVLLHEDIYPTRLLKQFPEIYCEIYSFVRQDSEGMLFEGEAGQVLDSMRILSKTNVSYPFKCWITYVKDRPGMPKWKISPNNNLWEIFSKPPNHLQRPESEVFRSEETTEDVQWLYDSDDEEPVAVPNHTNNHSDQQRTLHSSFSLLSEGRQSVQSNSNLVTRQSTPINNHHFPKSMVKSVDSSSVRSSPFGRQVVKEQLSYDQKSLHDLCGDILEDSDLVAAFKQMNPALLIAFEEATSIAKDQI